MIIIFNYNNTNSDLYNNTLFTKEENITMKGGEPIWQQ